MISRRQLTMKDGKFLSGVYRSSYRTVSISNISLSCPLLNEQKRTAKQNSVGSTCFRLHEYFKSCIPVVERGGYVGSSDERNNIPWMPSFVST